VTGAHESDEAGTFVRRIVSEPHATGGDKFVDEHLDILARRGVQTGELRHGLRPERGERAENNFATGREFAIAGCAILFLQAIGEGGDATQQNLETIRMSVRCH